MNIIQNIIGWVMRNTPSARKRRRLRAEQDQRDRVKLLREKFWEKEHQEWDRIRRKSYPGARTDSHDAAARHPHPNKILPFDR